MNLKSIVLKTKKDQSLLRKHPWVFSGAIKKADEGIVEGEIIKVFSNKGRFLGIGHFQNGTIAVRIVSFTENIPNDEFWLNKIREAYDLRANLGYFEDKTTNAFRLIHAEGDGLPGLIVDIYGNTAVMQFHSIGMYHIRQQLAEAIVKIFEGKIENVYNKSERTLKSKDIVATNQYIIGGNTNIAPVLENGNKFFIDWEGGQKTGFFIDQRNNRLLLGDYAQGKTILNTYCYSGGFSIYGLKNNAKEVHSLDNSAAALDLLEKNLEINELTASNHLTIKEEALSYLKESEEGKYDLIILDPPAFAKHQDSRHNAVQGYKRLNSIAMQKIKPGGIIFTFSCSQVVDKLLFHNTIIAAAIAVGRNVRVLHQLHQPPDHPINLFHPEGEYLKGLVIQVD